MEELPEIRETRDEKVNFDKLAFDVITGRSEEEIVKQLSEEGVEHPYEKVAWFSKGLLCSRRLLVKKDSKWYSKAADSVSRTMSGNEKLQGMFISGIVKELILCLLGFAVSLGLLFIPAQLFTSRFGIIVKPILQISGGILLVFFVCYFFWAVQMWWKSRG